MGAGPPATGPPPDAAVVPVAPAVEEGDAWPALAPPPDVGPGAAVVAGPDPPAGPAAVVLVDAAWRWPPSPQAGKRNNAAAAMIIATPRGRGPVPFMPEFLAQSSWMA